jgi:PAS domain-containing protein
MRRAAFRLGEAFREVLTTAGKPTPFSFDENALREIVEGTATETGETFFDGLVKHLARAIDTKCAWVTEWLEPQRRLGALSFWVGDGFYANFEHAIAGTPREPVIENRRLIHVPEGVLDVYAHDPSLEALGVVRYLGMPLLDTDGGILGHLAILHDAPMAEDERVTGIFNIFAGRAAAELREREPKLSRLIESATDSIVEIDGELRPTAMNGVAERVFGGDPSKARRAPLDAFLTREPRGKLAYVAAGLARQA